MSELLECLRIDAADVGTASAAGTLIWLHGLGADATDFEPVVPLLDLDRPLNFVFPNAPVRPVTINGGMEMRAWYDVDPGSPLAGEMSGHVFFADEYYGYDDALYAGVRLIAAAARLGKSVTELRSAMPPMINTPEMRFQVDESRKFAAIGEIAGRVAASDALADTTDGVRVTTDDGWWLLRASNTQDVLVARAESESEEGLARLVAQIDEQLAESGLERGPQAGH